MSEHTLYEGMQSPYKTGHSTETALVRVKNDILTSMEKNQCVLIVLLDLSAAFDTVDHSKLLRVLRYRISLGGTARMWFESYLRERTHAVAIRDSTAPSVERQRGVPQGSVHGTILFTIYTLALGDIVRRHDLNGHFYADAMQLYVSFDIIDNPSHQVHRAEGCIKDVKMWMAGNHLKLNDNKTEVITFTTPNVEMNMPIDVIQIGDYSIRPVQCVRDLGVVFDHHMTTHENITKTCASCYFHLRSISSIRYSLTDTAKGVDPDTKVGGTAYMSNQREVLEGQTGSHRAKRANFGRGVRGSSPGKFQKPTWQMVQSTLFLSYICEYY